MIIETDKVVYIRYKLYDDKNTLLGQTENDIPMAYIHGKAHIIAGLEEELEGKKAGDTLKVEVPFEKAYGARNPDLLKEIELEKFQSDEPLQVGMKVKLETSEGEMIALVTKVGDTHFTLDLNHPLASKNLVFEVDVVDVRTATENELDHGHVHGPGGHQH